MSGSLDKFKKSYYFCFLKVAPLGYPFTPISTRVYTEGYSTIPLRVCLELTLEKFLGFIVKNLGGWSPVIELKKHSHFIITHAG